MEKELAPVVRSSPEGQPPALHQVLVGGAELPALHVGENSPGAAAKYERFLSSVAEIFERWLARRKNERTQATYRNHVLQFVASREIRWPGAAEDLLRVTIKEVQEHRDELLSRGASNKTVNGRLSALSSFYGFLREVASEYRLPVSIPNPAHRTWIPRVSDKTKKPTRALTLSQAHELLSLPKGDSEVAFRDRAVLTLSLAAGLRVSSLCRLKVTDCFEDKDNGPQIQIWEKGDHERVEGLHTKAWVAVRQYSERAGITSGPLFRARLNRTSMRLSSRGLSVRSMERLLQSYLDKLPSGTVPIREGEHEVWCSVFHPHSIRATTATLLHEAGVHPHLIQRLLGHKKPETTQGYNKQNNKQNLKPRESASHKVPI